MQAIIACNEGVSFRFAEGCPEDDKCRVLLRFGSHNLRFDRNSLGLESRPDGTTENRDNW